MGRSNPSTQIENPVGMYMTYEAWPDKGYFSTYKDEKNIPINTNALYIVLETRIFGVGGFHVKSNKPIRSSIARNFTTDRLTVRVQGEQPFAYGLWAEIKDKVAAQGGKFVRYIYLMETTSKTICCAQLKGAAIMAWGEGLEKYHMDDRSHEKKCIYMQLTGTEPKTAAGNPYKSPLFGFWELDTSTAEGKALDDASMQADVLVQAYLNDVIKSDTIAKEVEEAAATTPAVTAPASEAVLPSQRFANNQYPTQPPAAPNPFGGAPAPMAPVPAPPFGAVTNRPTAPVTPQPPAAPQIANLEAPVDDSDLPF